MGVRASARGCSFSRGVVFTNTVIKEGEETTTMAACLCVSEGTRRRRDDNNGRLFVCVVRKVPCLVCVVNDGQGRRRDNNGGRLVCVVKGEGGVTLECALKVVAN